MPEFETQSVEVGKSSLSFKRIFLSLIVIVGILLLVFKGLPAWKEDKRIRDTYAQAMVFVTLNQFDDAKSLLRTLDRTYKETSEYLDLCNAHQTYDNGNIVGAHFYLIGLTFSDMPEEQKADFDSFVETVDADVAEYYKQKEIEEREERKKNVPISAPFIGMSESKIDSTELGVHHGEIRHNSEMIDGERHFANIYDFSTNGYFIFSARCIDGRVTDIWDYRSNPIPPRKPYTGYKDDDPYDVNDFRNAEDFYYEHYDDFFDYYDAEDYFNEHHD